MDKSINNEIAGYFDIELKPLETYSPLTLAFLGDGVFEMVIRSIYVNKGNKSVNKLNKDTSDIAKAVTQSKMIEGLETFLTKEEEAVYKRGRNAKSATSAKNAPIGDYRKATGLEALMGYLYLKGDNKRILELIKKGLEIIDKA
ncbi:ribonuclease-3 family protein [Acetitomaculum ruminis DSM 5522]|uniref:Mini-ribonuclease 3 n=1 Tax=Acetitomaculum ruminis DSM 5522 TaxID=1120918 RepID=A0A1I0WHJ4_9FIRM|nr:ribonuclease III domain-containing protein [Acetitomaculum ruminis]SFA88219.1 ribonuclease-3 family protein [Acetitomaculum ruminis DSM 5522]